MAESIVSRETSAFSNRLERLSGLLLNYLLREELTDSGGGIWLQYDFEISQHSPVTITSFGSALGNLYDGTAGIAYGLASSFLQTPSDDLADAVGRSSRHSLHSLLSEEQADLGLFTGFAGGSFAISAAKQVGRLDALGHLVNDFLTRFISSLDSEELCREEESFDLISGLAGMLCALRILVADDLIQERPEIETRLMRLIGTAARSSERGLTWPGTEDDAGLCSVAHGNSGIAAVLAGSTSEIRNELDLDPLVMGALRYESSWLSDPGSCWPDLRERLPETVEREPAPRPINFWCHGGPGIGLVRSFLIDLDRGDHNSRAELELARSLTLQSLDELYSQDKVPIGLCHGVTGLSLIAVRLGATASQVLPGLLELLESALVEEQLVTENSDYSGTETFGLMTGLSGVLYGLNALITRSDRAYPNPLEPWALSFR